MPRSFYKFKLLLDEGLPPTKKFPRLNQRFNIKHVVLDKNLQGAKDEELCKIAILESRIIITLNDKDFKKLVMKYKLMKVVGLSANLTTDQIDKKLTALLVRHKNKQTLGRHTYISSDP